jgi:DNA-binding transcriptional LysR family regulator
MRIMELRHLRYFVTVAEELHFGRAAERLHMSQPPLSMQIRALEEEIGARLLNRTQRHVSLTQAGNVFLQEARQILAWIEHAVLMTRRAERGEIGGLSVGFISVANYNVLPSVLRDFRRRYPLVNLTLKEATTDTQLEDLLNGRIDVGFVLPPIDEPALESVAILREPLIAALPTRHPAASRPGKIPLAALADSPFILFPRRMAPGLYDDIVSFCRKAGFSPRMEQEAIQMQTIVSLVSAELGVSLIPDSLKNLQRTGVVYRQLKEKSPLTEIHLTWRRQDALPTLRLFVELATSAARTAGRRRTRG